MGGAGLGGAGLGGAGLGGAGLGGAGLGGAGLGGTGGVAVGGNVGAPSGGVTNQPTRRGGGLSDTERAQGAAAPMARAE